MAGSYAHVTNDDGTLRTPKQINNALECMSGDVVEAVKEMYGMIWWLAYAYAEDMGHPPEAAASLVRGAVKAHKIGLTFSPGVSED